MSHGVLSLGGLLALGLLLGCSPAPAPAPAPASGPAAAAGPLKVAVTVAPQGYVVARLGGRRVAVQVLLPASANHEEYEPTLGLLTGLSGAALWLQVGPEVFDFEKAWAAKILGAAPGMVAVDTSRGLTPIARNPHFWLSPRLVRQTLPTLTAALIAADPAGRDDYARGQTQLEAELDALQAELTGLLAPARGKTLLFFHPAWTYLGADHGLNLLAIEQHGHEPGPGQLQELIETARGLGVQDVFVEPQISSRSAATVAAALGGQLRTVDPLAADWPGGLRQAARLFAAHAR